MPITSMWALNRSWYADRLDPDYAPRSAEEHQQMLEEVGLTDGFWSLR